MIVPIPVTQAVREIVSDRAGHLDEEARRARQTAIGVSELVSDGGAILRWWWRQMRVDGESSFS